MAAAEVTSGSHLERLLAHDQAALRCPHLAFPEMTQGKSVTWNEAMQLFVISGHEAAKSVMTRAAEFSNSIVEGPSSLEIHTSVLHRAAQRPEMQRYADRGYGTIPELRVLLTADPPLHTRQRSMIDHAFRPRRVAALEEDIRSLVHSLIDDFVEDGKVDLVGQFAAPLPLTVIATAMGLPVEDLELLHRLSSEFMVAIEDKFGNPTEAEYSRMVDTRVAWDQYMIAQVDARLAEPRDDLMQSLVDRTQEDDGLTLDELLWVAKIVFAGGNETTTNVIASGMVLLLEQPALLARLQDDPSLVSSFVEEALRMEPPVETLYRKATCDAEVDGVHIPEGSTVMLLVGAANRDADRFPHADVVDPDRTRSDNQHVSFGHGPHFCVGAHLARLELRLAFEGLLGRLGSVRMAGGTSTRDQVPYIPSWMLHGPARLDLEFDPGPRIGGRA